MITQIKKLFSAGKTQTKEVISYPRYITNLPLGQDLYPGGSQNNIAKEIAQLVKDDLGDTKLIGLDGGWGAGKSNLIEIIKNILNDTHYVYIHDAWGHQEDLQRRAFLEELTEDLCKESIINKSKWRSDLDDLLAKKIITTTKATPKLSVGIITFLFIFLSSSGFNTLKTKFPEYDVLISFLPLIVISLVWLIGSIGEKRVLGLADLFYLYKEKDLTTTVNETISETEPSVKDFKNWMEKLSEDLKKKKLIVVFDNMDRLPADKVRILWSSIHTFFANSNFKNIWVIVPFDRIHILSAFDDDRRPAESNHFINKTFSIIYRVSPPVLTDWKEFFRLKFNEAFGEGNDEDFDKTKNIYDLTQDSITPRNIIAFINELVSLKKIWDNEIPSRYMAIFILAKEIILTNPLQYILDRSYLGRAESIFIDDNDLSKYIASLVYNVPIEKANQVTFIREIEKALRENNSNRVDDLVNLPDFIDLLEQVINSVTVEIVDICKALSGSDNKLSSSERIQPKLMHVWDILSAKLTKTNIQVLAVQPYYETIFKYCSLDCKIRFLSYCLNQLPLVEKFSGEGYFNVLNQLENLPGIKDVIDITNFLTEQKLKAADFVSFVNRALDDYPRYKIKCDEAELDKYLASLVPSQLNTIQCLPHIKQDKLVSFKKSIENLIETGNIELKDVADLFSTYRILNDNSTMAKKLADIKIDELLIEATENTPAYYELVTMRLSRGNNYTGTSEISKTILKGNKNELVIEIASRIDRYSSYGGLLIIITKWQCPLLKAVLNEMTINNYSLRANTTLVLNQFGEVIKALDLDPKNLIQKLSLWPSPESITIDNIHTEVPDFIFYEKALELVDNRLAKYLLKVSKDHIEQQNIEQWEESILDSDSYSLTLLQLYFSKGILKIPANTVTAIKNILENIAKGAIDLAVTNNGNFQAIFKEIDTRKILQSTIKTIRDKFINDSNITASLFIFFSDYLIRYGALKDRAEDVVRAILTPICDNDQCLEIILANSELFTKLIKEAGDDASDFKDKIRQKLEAIGDSNQNLITFAKDIEVELEQEEIEIDESEKPEETEESPV